MATPLTVTQTFPGGIKAIYSLEGKDGILSLKVIGPTGQIIGTEIGSYADRDRILIQVTTQVANEVRNLQRQLDDVQRQINELNAILNNPNSTPEQKAEAERLLNRREFGNPSLLSQKEILETEVTNLRDANIAVGRNFAGIVTDLNEAATAPPATPTIDSTTSNALPSVTSNNSLPPASSDDSGESQLGSTVVETPIVADPNIDITDGNNTEAPVTNAPGTSEREESQTTDDLGEPGDPKYENEGFMSFAVDQNVRPGRRIKNPLGYLASYTYQLSLYMVTPDAYEAFVASGRKNIFALNDAEASDIDAAANDDRVGGIFLIAQSGGMGDQKYRAEGFELDYYIDNLSFESIIASKENDGPVANTSYRFKIVEPYGFSFVTKLKEAQENLRQASKDKTGTGKFLKNGNPTKMFYILGIRFYGWDQNGNKITGNEVFDGVQLDPTSSGSGALFETFYDIVITEFKFKIDGMATTYDIRAETASIAGTVNRTKGVVPDNKTVSGSTVRDLLIGPNGLLTQINKDQQSLLKNGSIEYPITYRVQWLGEDAKRIALAKMATANKTQKNNQPAADSKNTKESNDAKALKSSPNKNLYSYSPPGGNPIVQELEQIISQSSYLTDAMTKNFKDDAENNEKTEAPNSTKGGDRQLTWFNISPQISNIRWDSKLKDWSYTITYVIQTYLIPQVESPFVSKTSKYYGPHKRYDYWYTGQNTEILGYEQKIDNQFFLAVLSDPENDNEGDEGNTSSNPNQGGKNAVNKQANSNKTGSKGTPSLEAVNSFRTSLYDPSSFATAKIQILGDPDFLMHDTASGTMSGGKSLDQAYSKFYEADGFTVNPTGGQVFIEIDFKEAIDYTTDNISDLNSLGRGVTGQPGTLSINDSIEFWRYPDADIASRIKGVSYQVLTVNSTFQNGAFKQAISAVINPQSAEGALSKEGERERNEITGTTEENDNLETEETAVGTVKEKPVDQNTISESPQPSRRFGNPRRGFGGPNNLDDAG